MLPTVEEAKKSLFDLLGKDDGTEVEVWDTQDAFIFVFPSQATWTLPDNFLKFKVDKLPIIKGIASIAPIDGKLPPSARRIL